jgi:hypothetical protein
VIGLAAISDTADMPWSRKLKPPIALNDGRTLTTLKEAAELILSLPPFLQERSVWVYAAELLKDAAEGKRAATAEVGPQLYRTLTQSRNVGKVVQTRGYLSYQSIVPVLKPSCEF